MPFSRKPFLAAAIATQCVVATLAGAPAKATTIPDYFFQEWTVARSCAEQHAGLAARVQTGLKFKISRATQAQDGSFVFEAQDAAQQQWAVNWNGMKLQYREGTELTTLPADFVCIPGQEATNPFLALSNYAQSAEPYYEQRHWYGLAKIQGQLEHILIFPRNAADGSAVIIMQSVNSPGTVQLDDNGVIPIQK
jgi:hypothetical protein